MKHALVVLVVLALIPARVRADSSADQAEQAVVMLEQIATIVDTNKDNCDAMGDKLGTYLDKNGEKLKRLKAAGKTVSAEQKKAFTEKYKDRMQAVSSKMTPGMQKCSTHAKVKTALTKLMAS